MKLLQDITKKEAKHICEVLECISDKNLPSLLKLIKGINYEKTGRLSDADHLLLSLYDNDTDAVNYWEIINDFRIVNYHKLSNNRLKILTNVVGGRIGLGLIANADTISFLPDNSLGRKKASLITYRPLQDSLLDVIKQLPVKWEPDYILFFLSEVYPLPKGLELSPYPVIGLPGDPWKINKLCWDIKFFDALMPAMKHLCPAYKRIGTTAKIFYSSCSGTQGYIPWAFSDLQEYSLKKTYDVVYTGSVSSPFYRRRSQYLWRLLKLADRYKIFVGRTNTIQECYQLMAQAKIVIHCSSIQGGINLRPFEAIACGALLLHEEGDQSITEFFDPEKEVILFNENDFEMKIEQYLTHEKERKQIISRAQERNKKYAKINFNIRNVLKEITNRSVVASFRNANELTEDEKLNALGISSFYATDYDQAASSFAKAIQLKKDCCKYYNNLAVSLMVKYFDSTQEKGIVEEMLNVANQSYKSTPISRFNLLSYYGYYAFVPDKFINTAKKLIEDLQNKEQEFHKFIGDELFFYLEKPSRGFPDSFIFRMNLEFLLMNFPDRNSEYQKKISQTILWRSLEYLGDYYTKIEDIQDAIGCYRSALEYEPKNEFIIEKLANLLIRERMFEEADEVLQTLIVISPFNEEGHLMLSSVQMALGQKDKIKKRLTHLFRFDGLKNRMEFESIMDRASFG